MKRSFMHFLFRKLSVLSLIGLALAVAPAALHAQTPTILFGFTNSWRYNQTTSYDGVGWTAPNFDDSALPVGRGVLAVEDSGNAFVIGRTNTALTLGRTTYYFRTTFNYTGELSGAILTFSN